MTGLGDTRSDKQEKKEVRLRKDLAVFSFFLFLSFIFWYLNALGKEIQTEIKYPVQFINPPNGKLVSDEEPMKLSLNLKGAGYTILKLKLKSNSTPFIIDMSGVSYRRVPGSSGQKYYIITSVLTRNMPAKYMSGCDITSVKPDTLIFSMVDSERLTAPDEPDD